MGPHATHKQVLQHAVICLIRRAIEPHDVLSVSVCIQEESLSSKGWTARNGPHVRLAFHQTDLPRR